MENLPKWLSQQSTCEYDLGLSVIANIAYTYWAALNVCTFEGFDLILFQFFLDNLNVVSYGMIRNTTVLPSKPVCMTSLMSIFVSPLISMY
jgi:hypothetical protein